MSDHVGTVERDACPAGRCRGTSPRRYQTAVNGNASTFYLGLKAVGETDNTQWKKFANNPTMSVTYNTIPTQPSGFGIGPCYAQCLSPMAVNAQRPTFTAKATDPDAGQKVRLEFRVFQGSTTIATGTTAWGSTGQSLSWQPPANLNTGTTYTAQVRAHDGTDYGPWSAVSTFSIDVSASRREQRGINRLPGRRIVVEGSRQVWGIHPHRAWHHGSTVGSRTGWTRTRRCPT